MADRRLLAADPRRAASGARSRLSYNAKWADRLAGRGALVVVHSSYQYLDRPQPERSAHDVLPRLAAADVGQRGPGLGDVRARAEHRRRLRRPARPGLRGVLGDRRLHRRLADVGRSSTRSTSTSSARSRRRHKSPGIHIIFWIVLIIAGVRLRALGRAHRRARRCGCKSDYLALVTLGFGEIIPQFFYNGDDIVGHNLTNGTQGITPVDRSILSFDAPGVRRTSAPFDLHPEVPDLLPASPRSSSSCRCGCATGGSGRAWLAIREDELAASMMGVPLMRTKLAAYAVGAVAGGLGGVGVRHPRQRRPARPVQLRHLDHPAGHGRARRHGQRLGRHHRRAGAAWFNSTWLPQVRRLVQRRRSGPTSTSRRTTS